MDEIMSNEMEIANEAFESDENMIEGGPSGPSKGFVTLVVGGIATIVIGTAVAINRHKKKKKSIISERNLEDCDPETDVEVDSDDQDGEV